MASFVRVASKSEIPEGSAKCIEVGIDRIAIFNLGGSFYAIDDDCTHAGGSLSEGEIEVTEPEIMGEITGEAPCPEGVVESVGWWYGRK